MKIVIIGGSHAGIAACKFIKRIDPTVDLTLIEKTAVLAFIPSTVNLIFKKIISPDDLAAGEVGDEETLTQLGVRLLMNTEATQIDPQAKTITLQNKLDLHQQIIGYDFLILAMGSEKFMVTDALTPTETQQLLTYKEKGQTQKAYQRLTTSKQIAIIGAGLIGLELASSLAEDPSKKITIIERMNCLLFRYFDPEITDLLKARFPENVQVLFQESFQSIQPQDGGLTITLLTGKKLHVDTCVHAINPRPHIQLVKEILQLDFDETVIVDRYLQTSDPAIYAIGDLIRIPFGPKAESLYLPLISNARKTAFIAAANILSQPVPLPATQRTIGTELFGCYLGSTGITAAEAAFYDLTTFEVSKTYDRFSKYQLPESFSLTIKAIFDANSQQLLGAQLISTRRDLLDLINVLAQLIVDGKKASDLIFSDMFYNPQLSPSRNFLADLGLEALLQQASSKHGATPDDL